MGFSWWLTLAFIVLKLIGYIDWSWWWVISPILITISLLALLSLLSGLVSALETDEQRKVRKILDRLKKK